MWASTFVKNIVAYFLLYIYSYIKKWLQEETKLPLAGRPVNNILNEDSWKTGSVQPLIPQRIHFWGKTAAQNKMESEVDHLQATYIL